MRLRMVRVRFADAEVIEIRRAADTPERRDADS
jgi:hypothetical protein